MRTAIFLERDGVLNEVSEARGQPLAPRSLEQFKIRPEAETALARLKKAGFLLIVTTNQPNVSEGRLSRRELDFMHTILRRRLPVDDVLLCAHGANDHCSCRKPKPGLLTEAAFKYHLNLEHCFVVSDKWQDARAAECVGATSLLIDSPWNGDCHHDYVLPDLNAVADKILSLPVGFSYGFSEARVA
jgi:D-glycero-D-manno-heptose 1,7-bisphosphate phosphatase